MNTLQGRVAKCSSCDSKTTSSTSLAFFEFRGEGSDHATTLCGQCGYHKDVHSPINPSTGRAGITEHKFTACGDSEDRFYCGCYGWD